jgi:aldehyde dehydrogenase (NAD+)
VTDLEILFQKQRNFHRQMRKWDINHRKILLKLLRDAIKAQETAILQALATDFQKPEFETKLTEIYPVMSELNHTIKHMKRWAKSKKVPGGGLLLGTCSEIHREPRGNVLIIAPWNYPFQLSLTPLISAIAAGNTVILKPSELTPATSALINKILSEIFEPELISVVQGGAEVSQSLLALPFDHIFFTGSTRVGKIVMTASAKNLASVTLELGGKSPTIVDSNCDVELTAKKLVWGKFLNSGQTCVAPDYVFVDDKIIQSFANALQSEINRQLGGKIQAQIITEKHQSRLLKLVETSGGKILTPQGTTESRRLPPTIVLSPSLDSDLMKEEIFGPILPLIPYNSLDQVISYIQSHPKPLALYVFSKQNSFVSQILQETSAGGVCVNDTIIHLGNHHLPFGGVGESGMGSYHGEFGFRTFSHEKAVLRQGVLGKAATLLYPPYTEQKTKLFRFLSKF